MRNVRNAQTSVLNKFALDKMIRTAKSLTNYNWDASQRKGKPKGKHSNLHMNQPNLRLALPLEHGTQPHMDKY